MTAIAMCKICGEYEIATFQVHQDFCSDVCADRAYDYQDEQDCEYDDSTDDGEALASAGFGTDEDYGYYGEE